MIAFPGMLVGPAEKAGMKVPQDPDNFKFEDYIHFGVFCNVQLGASMPYPSAHWDNAKTIAAIPEADFEKMLLIDLLNQLALGYPIP